MNLHFSGRRPRNRCALSLVVLSAICLGSASAADEQPVVGKNQWLFYPHEFTQLQDAIATRPSLDLIQRVHRVLQKNGIQMAVALVPLKARVYAQNLPDSRPLPHAAQQQYDRLMKEFAQAGVPAVDINRALMAQVGSSSTPLFFRSDTHWSQAGALVAAQAVKQDLQAVPAIQAALQSLPVQPFQLSWANREVDFTGDLGQLLSKSASYPPEKIRYYDVTKAAGGSGAGLLGDQQVGVALIGTSYSKDWTGFPNALRYSLQRDVLTSTGDGLIGQWVSLQNYLRNDAFQTSPPKVLIWEMPERDFFAAPNFKWREARYVIPNNDWLMQTSAWVQRSCLPSGTQASLTAGNTGAQVTANGLQSARPTQDSQYFDVGFSRPMSPIQYLSAQLTIQGSSQVALQALSPNGAPVGSRWTVPVVGDGQPHAWRVALPEAWGAASGVRVFPGRSTAMRLADLTVCAQPPEATSR